MKKLNKSLKVLAGLGLASSLLCGMSSSAYADEPLCHTCAYGAHNSKAAPGIAELLKKSPYKGLYAFLYPYTTPKGSPSLLNDLTALQAAQTAGNGQDAAYATLATDAAAVIATYTAANPAAKGTRLVIADPDGDVVYDSAKSLNPGTCPNYLFAVTPATFPGNLTLGAALYPTTTPTTALPPANSFECYHAKGVNENHNTRQSFMAAEIWPCGVGAEEKFSTTVNVTQQYVAIRLGPAQNGIGVVRIGINAQ